YGIIAIGIPTNELDWGKGALAHELGHMVTHQITFSPYGANLPFWLDEGLAMYAEGKPDPYLVSVLEKAITQHNLISVRSLASPFSALTEQAYISYAESQSLVPFLIQNYGRDKMLQLLNLFKEGSTYDEALTQVYGFDQDGLDAQWQRYITSQTQSQSKVKYDYFWEKVTEKAPRNDITGEPITANVLLGVD
ncbi:MAG: peptidase MA family metallohydrolase, partial [Dehalococcoidia bacterium]